MEMTVFPVAASCAVSFQNNNYLDHWLKSKHKNNVLCNSIGCGAEAQVGQIIEICHGNSPLYIVAVCEKCKEKIKFDIKIKDLVSF